MDPIYLEAAIFVLIGGIIFSLALDNLIPFFGTARLPIRGTMIIIASVGSLFWSTWLFPMGILLMLLGRPVFIVIVLTILYFVFLVALLATTYFIGRFKGAS